MPTRLRPILAVLAGCLALATRAPEVRAQIGLGTDLLTGAATRPDRTPLAGVQIEAFSLETQVTRRATTDRNGRFTILFPDGGGQYRLTARAIGFTPVQEVVTRHGDEDRLVWNVTLTPGAVMLDAINVEERIAPTPVRLPNAPTPGSAERAINPELVARLPIDPEDLNLLATLVPGVVGLDASDTTGAAFSVAGLGPGANAVMLDGLTAGSAAVPQDAIRTTRVITSTYDVARGQFSGGLVAATTRSGSNVLQGTSNYALRDDDLAVQADEESAFTQGFTQHNFSLGLGGPIVRDRLFVFGSGQARLRSDPLQSLLTAESRDFSRLGVHPDSIARFLALADAAGIPSGTAASSRSNDNLSGLLRVDLLLSNSHTLTLRGDWRGTDQEPARLGPLALPATGGIVETSGGGGMAALTSRFGTRLINELRGYVQSSRQDGDPFVLLPQGRVQVASELEDTTTGVATLVFGGNPGLPSRSRTRNLELADELSWLVGAGHRLKVGGLFGSDRTTDEAGTNRLGTFTYNSLADLEADRPASFRRTLAPVARTSHALSGAVYAGDVWAPSAVVQLTYGVRAEASWFGAAPSYNAAVDSVFGRRTDALPAEWHLSPRAGFTLSFGPRTERGRFAEPPTLVLRGGIGEFRNRMPAGLVSQVYGGTGLDSAGAEIVCIGPGVPPPDWTAWAADPSSIPDACAAPGPTPTRAARTVTLFDEGFQASRAWRASLAAEKRLSALFRLTVDGSLSRGVAQVGYRDLNLAPAPAFTLAAEGNRPVYVPEGDIAPATGALRFTGSRADPRFGQVVEARSDLASESWQLTVGVGGILGRGILLQTSYTHQHARDQATGLRGSTAGDPNLAEWARSGFERRHQFLATVTYPFGTAVELTSIARFTSGAPYTPTVGNDINGDGSRNDRAFVFAPDAGGPEGDGMAQLLNGASGRVRDCLDRQSGRVAGRNTCTGPWQPTLDLQLNWRPSFLGLNRRLMVSVVTVNLLRGIDELVHGADGAKGWGMTPRPDPTLLYVTGYDTVARRFQYAVNGRFGATAGSANAFRPPFQIGVQARFTLGPDRRRQALDALRGRTGGPADGRTGGPGALGRGGNPADFLSRLETVLPNPAAQVLERRAELALTPEQVTRLEAVRDSFALRNRTRADSLRAVVEREGATPDPARLLGVLRPLVEAGRRDADGIRDTIRGMLTPEQWSKLPERMREPPQRQRRPGQP